LITNSQIEISLSIWLELKEEGEEN